MPAEQRMGVGCCAGLVDVNTAAVRLVPPPALSGLAAMQGSAGGISKDLWMLTVEIDEREAAATERIAAVAPPLLAIVSCTPTASA